MITFWSFIRKIINSNIFVNILDPKSEDLLMCVLITTIIPESEWYIFYDWFFFKEGGWWMDQLDISSLYRSVWLMDPKHVKDTSILVPEIIPESVG